MSQLTDKHYLIWRNGPETVALEQQEGESITDMMNRFLKDHGEALVKDVIITPEKMIYDEAIINMSEKKDDGIASLEEVKEKIVEKKDWSKIKSSHRRKFSKKNFSDSEYLYVCSEDEEEMVFDDMSSALSRAKKLLSDPNNGSSFMEILAYPKDKVKRSDLVGDNYNSDIDSYAKSAAVVYSDGNIDYTEEFNATKKFSNGPDSLMVSWSAMYESLSDYYYDNDDKTMYIKIGVIDGLLEGIDDSTRDYFEKKLSELSELYDGYSEVDHERESRIITAMYDNLANYHKAKGDFDLIKSESESAAKEDWDFNHSQGFSKNSTKNQYFSVDLQEPKYLGVLLNNVAAKDPELPNELIDEWYSYSTDLKNDLTGWLWTKEELDYFFNNLYDKVVYAANENNKVYLVALHTLYQTGNFPMAREVFGTAADFCMVIDANMMARIKDIESMGDPIADMYANEYQKISESDGSAEDIDPCVVVVSDLNNLNEIDEGIAHLQAYYDEQDQNWSKKKSRKNFSDEGPMMKKFWNLYETLSPYEPTYKKIEEIVERDELSDVIFPFFGDPTYDEITYKKILDELGMQNKDLPSTQGDVVDSIENLLNGTTGVTDVSRQKDFMDQPFINYKINGVDYQIQFKK